MNEKDQKTQGATPAGVPTVTASVPDDGHLKGIQTALNQMEVITKTLQSVVNDAMNSEKAGIALREKLSKVPELKDDSAYIDSRVKKLTDENRTAVSRTVSEYNTHFVAINDHVKNIVAKFGAPVVVAKAPAGKGLSKQTNYGTVTDANKDALESILRGHGYTPIFVLLDDGVHYQVTDTGTGRTGRFAKQIEKDWI
jgi:hypothetical protein